MRSPGTKFWRRVTVASRVLLLASAAAATVTVFHVGGWLLARRTALTYGYGHIYFAHTSNTPLRNYIGLWRSQPSGFKGVHWRPYAGLGGSDYHVALPAQYLCVPPLVTGIVSVIALRRAKKRTVPLCTACDYNLAGLPADAVACPECGGKIGKSTAEGKTGRGLSSLRGA